MPTFLLYFQEYVIEHDEDCGALGCFVEVHNAEN